MDCLVQKYLVRAAPASPSWALSWTPAAARSQSRPRRRNLWTKSPAETPPVPPWTASSGALQTHTHSHWWEVLWGVKSAGFSLWRKRSYSCAVWGACRTWQAALFHPPRYRCPRSWGSVWRESDHEQNEKLDDKLLKKVIYLYFCDCQQLPWKKKNLTSYFTGNYFKGALITLTYTKHNRNLLKILNTACMLRPPKAAVALHVQQTLSQRWVSVQCCFLLWLPVKRKKRSDISRHSFLVEKEWENVPAWSRQSFQKLVQSLKAIESLQLLELF